jgi:alpha-amylase
MLAPGAVQIYYGDEIARSLVIPKAKGDSTLRSNMDWSSLDRAQTKAVLAHWQKLGQFRARHPLGTAAHTELSQKPYTFSRQYCIGESPCELQHVVIALDVKSGQSVPVGQAFENGLRLRDAYNNKTYVVNNNAVKIDAATRVVLLEVAEAN